MLGFWDLLTLLPLLGLREAPPPLRVPIFLLKTLEKLTDVYREACVASRDDIQHMHSYDIRVPHGTLSIRDLSYRSGRAGARRVIVERVGSVRHQPRTTP